MLWLGLHCYVDKMYAYSFKTVGKRYLDERRRFWSTLLRYTYKCTAKFSDNTCKQMSILTKFSKKNKRIKYKTRYFDQDEIFDMPKNWDNCSNIKVYKNLKVKQYLCVSSKQHYWPFGLNKFYLPVQKGLILKIIINLS